MSAISRTLRQLQGDRIAFWCPGCNTAHSVAVNADKSPSWSWNGDVEKPTFSPSILVRSGHYVPMYDGGGCWCDFNAELAAKGEEPTKHRCGICHSFVTNGCIQFLGDCTHELAGKTVDLPPWPGDEVA